MRARVWYYPTLGVALLLAGSGCGSKLVKVKGVLTLEGQPVEGAVVTFASPDGRGRPATGQTDAEGRFTLTTLEEGDGALPGDYRVLIGAPRNVPFVLDQLPPTRREYLELKEKSAKELKDKPPPFGADIAKIYADPEKTPLTQHVPPAEGTVRIALDASARDKNALKSPPPRKGVAKAPIPFGRPDIGDR
jgi:hypothetical protein